MFGQKTSAGIEPPQPAGPVSGVSGAPGFVEPEVHILDRLHILYKYRKSMISVCLLVFIAGTVQTLTTTPEYMATAVVRAEQEQQSIQATSAALYALYGGDSDSFMLTELRVLQSRDLQRKVVRKLNLTTNPEFNGKQTPSGMNATVSSLKALAMRPIRSLFGSTPPPAPPAAVPPSSVRTLPNPEQIETPAETTAIEAVGKSLKIEPQQTTHVFSVSFSSRSPQTAALVANAISSEYVDQNLEQKTSKMQEQLKVLNELLIDLRAKIDADKRTLLNTTVDAQFLDADQVSRSVTGANADLNAKTSALQQAQAKSQEMAALDPENIDAALAYPDIQAAPNVATLESQLRVYKASRTDLLTNKGQGLASPLVLQQDTNIAGAQKDLKAAIVLAIQTAKNKYQAALADERLAAKTYQEQKNLQVSNSRIGISYNGLSEQIKANETLYSVNLQQQKATEIAAKGVTNNVSMVDFAQPPGAPYTPNTSRNILISLMLGIALAVMLAFGLDYLDDTIKTPEDITRKLHVPFLGLVPAVKGDRQPVLSGPVPHDFGEAYRALRTSLVFTSGGESTRIMTVTSAQPLEGKTTTACNLAMVLAFGGSRVLLIDADMRRPGVHKALKITNTVGLSHLLVGQARVREAIQRTSDPNFCVMTAGRTPPNPSELLSSERMKQLVANLKQGPFDWVVIDTPPVLAVTDAVILTPLVDGVTFVLGAEMTRRRLAERAVQMLMGSRPKVIGAVLNRVNFDRNKYYYSRYYGYQYKSYYGTTPHDAATAKG